MHLGVCIIDLQEISLHIDEWSPAMEQPFVTVWPFVPEEDNHCLIGRLFSVAVSSFLDVHKSSVTLQSMYSGFNAFITWTIHENVR